MPHSVEVQLPTTLAAKLRRFNLQVRRRKGRFSIAGNYQFGHPQRQNEAFYIDWQDQIDVGDASRGYEPPVSEHVGTIDVARMRGAGNGYLFMLKDMETDDWVPIALWSADTLDFGWRQDRDAHLLIADHFNGMRPYEKNKGASTAAIALFVLGVLTIPIGIGFFLIIMGVVASRGKRPNVSMERPKIDASDIWEIIDGLASYLKASGNLPTVWMLEANGVSSVRLS